MRVGMCELFSHLKREASLTIRVIFESGFFLMSSGVQSSWPPHPIPHLNQFCVQPILGVLMARARCLGAWLDSLPPPSPGRKAPRRTDSASWRNHARKASTKYEYCVKKYDIVLTFGGRGLRTCLRGGWWGDRMGRGAL